MKKYYIENRQRGHVGNCLLFWRVGGRGYTCNVNEAQQFTYDGAVELVAGRDKYRAWPVEHVISSAVRHCDMQDMDYSLGITEKSLMKEGVENGNV